MPLKPPPRDSNGEVTPHDHEEIEAADGVIRRVQVTNNWVVNDPKSPTGRRVTSMAFKPSSGGNKGMSIDLERLIIEAGHDVRSFVTNPQWIGSLKYTAGALRLEGLKVGYEPIEGNPYHGEVWGGDTRKHWDRLRAIAQWFVPIEGVSL